MKDLLEMKDLRRSGVVTEAWRGQLLSLELHVCWFAGRLESWKQACEEYVSKNLPLPEVCLAAEPCWHAGAMMGQLPL